MIEFVGKDIKAVIRTIFHVFKRREQRLSMLSRDTKDVKGIQEVTWFWKDPPTKYN